jgi:hypothetical protein
MRTAAYRLSGAPRADRFVIYGHIYIYVRFQYRYEVSRTLSCRISVITRISVSFRISVIVKNNVSFRISVILKA